MLKIVEIPENSLPTKYAKIYPEFRERGGIVLDYHPNGPHYIIDLETYVPMERDYHIYLVGVRFRYSESSTNEGIEKHAKFKEVSIDNAHFHCKNMIDNYKVPESFTNFDTLNGVSMTIYKYKKIEAHA